MPPTQAVDGRGREDRLVRAVRPQLVGEVVLVDRLADPLHRGAHLGLDRDVGGGAEHAHRPGRRLDHPAPVAHHADAVVDPAQAIADVERVARLERSQPGQDRLVVRQHVIAPDHLGQRRIAEQGTEAGGVVRPARPGRLGEPVLDVQEAARELCRGTELAQELLELHAAADRPSSSGARPHHTWFGARRICRGLQQRGEPGDTLVHVARPDMRSRRAAAHRVRVRR